MGQKDIVLQLPADYTDNDLKKRISKKLNVKEFLYTIEKKSLDARQKRNIHWLIRLSVASKEIKGNVPDLTPPLIIPYQKRKEKAVVVGSGPAGFFSAFILQKAGFHTTLIERGSEVEKRAKEINAFEKGGIFSPANNYAFGEGGAGTFSDGKLTSRSKHIEGEKQFILSQYISAGAPEEIRYLAHPHLGSDNLRGIVKNVREAFISLGGTVLFETILEDLNIKNGMVIEAITASGSIEGDFFIIAPGHSAYETYRMLMKRGVQFRTKNFAIGSRVEHPQEIINRSQWGRDSVPGLQAAEYRLTSKGDGRPDVYTFCMCPGGKIVPAAVYENTNVVNGMSFYKRDGKFANTACVAAVNLDSLRGKTTTPQEALDWVSAIEEKFYTYSDGYAAPFCQIKDFITRREASCVVESSYPLGLKPAPLWDLLPAPVSNAIREGLKDFNKKIKGFETGLIMGLESKTSSPIQVVRDERRCCEGFLNLYLVGEGSGYAGGIISSAVDGIKAVLGIINK